jgi:hypothetical protein
VVFINTNSDKDTLYTFANSIDYNGIAALGGGKVPAEENSFLFFFNRVFYHSYTKFKL